MYIISSYPKYFNHTKPNRTKLNSKSFQVTTLLRTYSTVCTGRMNAAGTLQRCQCCRYSWGINSTLFLWLWVQRKNDMPSVCLQLAFTLETSRVMLSVIKAALLTRLYRSPAEERLREAARSGLYIPACTSASFNSVTCIHIPFWSIKGALMYLFPNINVGKANHPVKCRALNVLCVAGWWWGKKTEMHTRAGHLGRTLSSDIWSVTCLAPHTTIRHREGGKKKKAAESPLCHLSNWNPAECFWISGAFCECSDAGNVTVSIPHLNMLPRGHLSLWRGQKGIRVT